MIILSLVQAAVYSMGEYIILGAVKKYVLGVEDI
jgi:hypothetical protein